MHLWASFERVIAGKASLLPVYGPHPATAAFEAAMRESDKLAARLAEERQR
jgi:hypothetical protein